MNTNFHNTSGESPEVTLSGKVKWISIFIVKCNTSHRFVSLYYFVLTGSIELHHYCDHLCNQKMFDVFWMMYDVIRDG